MEALVDSKGRGVKLTELIAPAHLNQARVNKCFITLVNRRLVRNDHTMCAVSYHCKFMLMQIRKSS
ncbi:hypothetical protein EDD17DRAFT_1526577 [Pisolithus thermaeus]|nr:hypothetical protein EDD17DRAFT_1526577 [Pisolithus thermaeus]